MAEKTEETPKRNPVELLAAQANRLAELYALQKQQQVLLEQIEAHNATEAQWTEFLGRNMFPGKQKYSRRQSVRIVDFDIPFWSLVVFLVKLGLAAIPAAFILWVLFWVLTIMMLVVTVSLGVFASGMSSINDILEPAGLPTSTPLPAETGTVQYRLLGSGPVDITYRDAEGESQEETVFLPWTTTFESTEVNTFFSLSADAEDIEQEIACEILHEGEIIEESTSVLGYVICTGFIE